jgi:hypothetical protein
VVHRRQSAALHKCICALTSTSQKSLTLEDDALISSVSEDASARETESDAEASLSMSKRHEPI